MVVGLTVCKAFPLVVPISKERLLALKIKKPSTSRPYFLSLLQMKAKPWRRQSVQRANASQEQSPLSPRSDAWRFLSKMASLPHHQQQRWMANLQQQRSPASAADGNPHLVVAAKAVELVQLIGSVAGTRSHLPDVESGTDLSVQTIKIRIEAK